MLDKLSPLSLGIILLIVIMIFGVGKLPQIGSDIGKSIRAFRDSQGNSDEDEEELTAPKVKRKVKRKTQNT